jgi:hypothetical protein
MAKGKGGGAKPPVKVQMTVERTAKQLKSIQRYLMQLNVDL